MSIYQETIFPWFMDKVMGSKRFFRERALALQGVSGEVLEIGFGTGLNLPHYPEAASSLTALEPSGGMLRRARPRAESSALPVLLVRDDAEALPFEDGRFDTVVSTWTLCTIADVRRALLEVKRVLRPGGRFLFMEHGRAPSERWRRIQDLINPLNKRLACGCNLNRDIPGLIAEAGFRIVELHRYVMPKTPSLLAFAAYTFRGAATPRI